MLSSDFPCKENDRTTEEALLPQILLDTGRKPGGNHWKIQAVFSDNFMGITQIKEYYNQFKDGHTSVDSNPCSGRPSTNRNDPVINKVNAVVMQDHQVTIREIVEEVDISSFLAHSIWPKIWPGSLLIWYGSVWLLAVL